LPQDSATQVRAAFLHQPTGTDEDAADSPYAFSSLLYSLVSSKQLAEVYPSELVAFLDLKIGPDGPKRSLDDMWTQDNPITPFLESGLKIEDQAGLKKYRRNVAKFVSKLGLQAGEPAIVINGRVRLPIGHNVSKQTS
jgi:hypothetical protein